MPAAAGFASGAAIAGVPASEINRNLPALAKRGRPGGKRANLARMSPRRDRRTAYERGFSNDLQRNSALIVALLHVIQTICAQIIAHVENIRRIRAEFGSQIRDPNSALQQMTRKLMTMLFVARANQPNRRFSISPTGILT
jgi:hypothetical protein